MSTISQTTSTPLVQSLPTQTPAPKVESAPAKPAPAQPSMAADSVSTSQKSGAALPVTELSFSNRLGSASKVGLGTMVAGAIAGGLYGARTGGSGGGYGAALGAVLGGGMGILAGGAAGMAAGTGGGLIYSYMTQKSGTAQPAQAAQPSAPVSDLNGATPVNASRDFWGDVSKGALTGTLAGSVTGAVIGGMQGAKAGGNFPGIGIMIMGTMGALTGAGIGLVGGGAAGAIYSKTQD